MIWQHGNTFLEFNSGLMGIIWDTKWRKVKGADTQTLERIES
jgi:hypothetical protein